MNRPEQEAARLIKVLGRGGALEIAVKQLEEENPRGLNWHAQAVYCYVKGYYDALICNPHAAALQNVLGRVSDSRMDRAWRGESYTFDGATVPTRGWELIAVLTEEFLTAPPEQALDRGEWEARQKSKKPI